MNSLNNAVVLLSRTTGRDKIYKLMGGMFDILASIAKKNNSPNYRSYSSISPAIINGRSLLRLGKFIEEFPRLRMLIRLIKAQGVRYTDRRHFLQIIRCILNSLWIFGDNIAFLAKYGVIDGDPVDLWEFGKTCQFWGFALCMVLDLFDIREGFYRWEFDPRWSAKFITLAVLAFFAHLADLLETMPQVGYLTEVWKPSSFTSGLLTVFSATMATSMNMVKVCHGEL